MSLIAHLTCQETGTSPLLYNVYGLSGGISGTTPNLATIAGPNAQYPRALSLDGVNDSIYLDPTNVLNGVSISGITISILAKLNYHAFGTGAATNYTLFNVPRPGGSKISFLGNFPTQQNALNAYAADSSGQSKTLVTTGNPYTGEWHLYTATVNYAANTLKIYVDDIERASTAGTFGDFLATTCDTGITTVPRVGTNLASWTKMDVADIKIYDNYFNSGEIPAITGGVTGGVLVGHWPLQDTGSNTFVEALVAPSTGYALPHGTISGGRTAAQMTVPGPNWPSGTYSRALYFNGVSDAVIIPTSGYLRNLSEYSVTFRVNFYNTGLAASQHSIYSISRESNIQKMRSAVFVQRTTTSGVSGTYSNVHQGNGAVTTIQSAGSQPLTGWHNFAFVNKLASTGHTSSLYLDGNYNVTINDGASTLSGFPDSDAEKFAIAHSNIIDNITYNFAHCAIADFRIYNYGLTTGQIRQINDEAPPTGDPAGTGSSINIGLQDLTQTRSNVYVNQSGTGGGTGTGTLTTSWIIFTLGSQYADGHTHSNTNQISGTHLLHNLTVNDYSRPNYIPVEPIEINTIYNIYNNRFKTVRRLIDNTLPLASGTIDFNFDLGQDVSSYNKYVKYFNSGGWFTDTNVGNTNPNIVTYTYTGTIGMNKIQGFVGNWSSSIFEFELS